MLNDVHIFQKFIIHFFFPLFDKIKFFNLFIKFMSMTLIL